MIYILSQLVTMFISVAIKMNKFLKTYKKIGDNGFKIDSQKMENISNKKEESNLKKSIINVLDLILFFIPGINMISASISSNITKTEFLKRLEQNNALIPMTDEEYEFYNNLSSISKKINFVSYHDEISKRIDYIKTLLDEERTVLEKNIAQLYYDKLPPIAYTLEGIKKLSNAIDSNYKVGIMDGINVAIIGLPKEECKINYVILRNKNSLEQYEYKELNEKDINNNNNKFIVYPFGFDFEENDELKNSYQDIIDNRNYFRKNKRSSMIKFNDINLNNKEKIYVKKKVK